LNSESQSLILKSSMKLSIIANPIAGRGRAYREIQSYVRQWPHQDWEVEILTTRDRNHAGLLAQELVRHPPDLLAICGGDGTVNEIATCVPQPPFPVALLPAGTANVLARELSLPLNPIKALKIALKRAIRRIDLGNLGPESRRRFLFVGGIGFDAYVVSNVRPGLKSKLGMAAYALAILECLKSYSFPEFQVVIDNRTFTATSCLACNSRRYGGGLLFCPNADMNDGLLDVLVLQGKRRVELARFLFQAWLGRPESGDWIHRLQSKAFRIEGPESVLIQADGELTGSLPVEVTLSHSAFPLVIP
jgi:diacylglycerol kinase (ATP)